MKKLDSSSNPLDIFHKIMIDRGILTTGPSAFGIMTWWSLYYADGSVLVFFLLHQCLSIGSAYSEMTVIILNHTLLFLINFS